MRDVLDDHVGVWSPHRRAVRRSPRPIPGVLTWVSVIFTLVLVMRDAGDELAFLYRSSSPTISVPRAIGHRHPRTRQHAHARILFHCQTDSASAALWHRRWRFSISSYVTLPGFARTRRPRIGHCDAVDIPTMSQRSAFIARRQARAADVSRSAALAVVTRWQLPPLGTDHRDDTVWDSHRECDRVDLADPEPAEPSRRRVDRRLPPADRACSQPEARSLSNPLVICSPAGRRRHIPFASYSDDASRRSRPVGLAHSLRRR
jgi:hypothetical protein